MTRVVGRLSSPTDDDQQGRVFSRTIRGGGELSQYPVLDASPNAIVAIDEQGRIVYVNPQVEVTFGFGHAELIGKLVEVLLPARVGERHVSHRNAFLAHPVARPMGIGLDLAGRRKDGTEFPVEISLSPVETADGMQAFATIVDISARKAAESQLAESERRFRAVLEASPNAVLAIDEQGRIVYVNPQVETTFGYDHGELIGKLVEDLLPGHVGERHVSHRNAFLAHPVARPMGIGLDLAGRRKDGTEFPVEISLSPVETADGMQAFATIVDIGARKAAESQLLQAQKLESIGRLAGGIAHDFNNMLFAIRGYAELLAEDLAVEPSPELDTVGSLESVAAITRAADKAAELTGQLLAFSRQQVVSPKVIALNPGIKEVEPMLRRLIGENLNLVVKLDPAAGNVMADSGHLDQILVNLVVNARDAMPAGGTVTIETGNVTFDEPYAVEHFDVTAGPYVLLAVTDTGIGMDHETRQHIFEPFFTTKQLGKGTGLGLATIYGIVRQAGGHIWLYSEPGRGSSFKLYFPRVDAPADAAPHLAVSTAIEGGMVMVVEDEPAVRNMVAQLLERAGYEVIAVADGLEATTRAASEQPIDVLVTDVVMPNMSGIDLAEQMMDRYPLLGVILLSGYTAESLNIERVIGRGAIFVPKPITSQRLIQAVHQAAANARAATARATGRS
jgi:PAS domain S-box-containing protein